MPASIVATSDRSRAINAAASAEMTRTSGRPGPGRRARRAGARPRPPIKPEPSQATASTRRTGTPSVDVISRSSASARIAVPSFVKRRNAATAERHGDAEGEPTICV